MNVQGPGWGWSAYQTDKTERAILTVCGQGVMIRTENVKTKVIQDEDEVSNEIRPNVNSC